MLKQIESKIEKKHIIQNFTLYYNHRSKHLVSVNGFGHTSQGLMVIYVDYHEEDLLARIKMKLEADWFEDYQGKPIHSLYLLPTQKVEVGNGWSNPKYQ